MGTDQEPPGGNVEVLLDVRWRGCTIPVVYNICCVLRIRLDEGDGVGMRKNDMYMGYIWHSLAFTEQACMIQWPQAANRKTIGESIYV